MTKATWTILVCSLALACKGDPEETTPAYGPPAPQGQSLSKGEPGATIQTASGRVDSPSAKPEKIDYINREQPAPKLASYPKDVIGFQLGMTPAQALQILDDESLFPKGSRYSFRPEVTFFDTTPIRKGQKKQIQRVRIDGRKNAFDTSNEALVVQSIAHAAGNRVVLEFALPPEPNVLIELGRIAVHHNPSKNEGTALDIFAKAVTEKYGEPTRVSSTPRKGDALETFVWAQPGTDCSSRNIHWGTATSATHPPPESCATMLVIEVNHFTQGEYLGMVQQSSTTLGNRGTTFLNRQRHEEWLKQTQLNWEQARRDQIRAAGKDTKAPTL